MPRKKTITKSSELLAMPVAYGDRCFFVRNGPVLCSPKDLREALKAITSDQYLFHAGGGRNDFATWVREVFGDSELAEALHGATNKKEAVSVLTKYLKRFS